MVLHEASGLTELNCPADPAPGLTDGLYASDHEAINTDILAFITRSPAYTNNGESNIGGYQ